MPSTNYAWASGALFVGFFLLIIFGNLAIYNSSINCPKSGEQLYDDLAGADADILTQVTSTIGILFSPCSGLEWWVYLLIFIPIGFGVIAFLNPFTG